MDSSSEESFIGNQQVTVLFFATLKERTGARQAVIELSSGRRVQ